MPARSAAIGPGRRRGLWCSGVRSDEGRRARVQARCHLGVVARGASGGWRSRRPRGRGNGQRQGRRRGAETSGARMRRADQGCSARCARRHHDADPVKAHHRKVRHRICCRSRSTRGGRSSRAVDRDADGLAGSDCDCGDRRRRRRMTVHFIGAGPGAPDLLTLRGRDLIAACPVCLYAGSLVPEGVLAHCPPGARIVNTASLSLDEIIAEIAAAHAEGKDVARLHSGDLSIWSAMGEQLRRLRALGIPYTVTPGVPAFSAAAAALEAELTLPGLAQTVVLTRTPGRASAMPEGEKLAAFAATGAVLAIHLSIHLLDKVIAELTPHYGADCPVAIVWRASWPAQRIVRATLATLDAAVGPELERTTLILVGKTLGADEFAESRLYAAD